MDAYTADRLRTRRRKDPLPMIIGLACLVGIPVAGYFIYAKVLNPPPPVVTQPVATPAPQPVEPKREKIAITPQGGGDNDSKDYFAGIMNAGSGPPSTVTAAVDRIGSQIHDALQVRKSLVVWLFDRSASATEHRTEVVSRFETLYRSLAGVTPGDASADKAEAPLLSAVAAYGSQVEFLTEEPTADATQLVEAARGIAADDGYVENTFNALNATIDKYLSFGPRGGRNMTIVLVSDEVGDDQHFADQVGQTLTRYAIRLHVIGVSALFGVEEGANASVEGGGPGTSGVRVRRGPESREVEWIDLDFPTGALYGNTNRPAFESGLGPYSLARLCELSGGDYFALSQGVGGYSGMPMSGSGGGMGGGGMNPGQQHLMLENNYWTAGGASGASTLPSDTGMTIAAPTVDSNFLQKQYKPRYMTEEEYQAAVKGNRALAALVKASQLPRAESLGGVQTTFIPGDDNARFVREVDMAQRPAARVMPGINAFYDALREGENDRAKLTEPRWQAGFDLALGRAMAARARAEGYVTMLATLKTGPKFQNEGSTTWMLVPAPELTVSSTLDRMAKKSIEYLQGVIEKHPGTPWASAAASELATLPGWKWEER